jgi:hypothetical protein
MTLLSGVYGNGGWGVRGNLHKFKHNLRKISKVLCYPERGVIDRIKGRVE